MNRSGIPSRGYPGTKRQLEAGFTLLEMTIVVVIIGVIASMSVPFYLSVVRAAEIKSSVADLDTISRAVDAYTSQHGYPPESLSEIGVAGFTDPWGRPYQYQRLNAPAADEVPVNAVARLTSNNQPVNSDYDLYTVGRDGKAMANLAEPVSLDDVIRADNGLFLGPVEEYVPPPN